MNPGSISEKIHGRIPGEISEVFLKNVYWNVRKKNIQEFVVEFQLNVLVKEKP